MSREETSKKQDWHASDIVMFDFDGTLTDAVAFFSDVMRKTAENLGASSDQLLVLANQYPHESREAFKHLRKTLTGMSEEIIKDMFLSVWPTIMPHFMKDDVLKVFTHLKQTGIPFAVVTNTPGEFVEGDFKKATFLQDAGFEGTKVYGLVKKEHWLESTKNPDSSYHAKKPKLAGLIRASEDFIAERDPQRIKWSAQPTVIYVGNRYESDAIAAYNAGMIPVIIDPQRCSNGVWPCVVVWKTATQENNQTTVGNSRGSSGFPVIAIRSLGVLTSPEFQSKVDEWNGVSAIPHRKSDEPPNEVTLSNGAIHEILSPRTLSPPTP